MSSFLRTLVAGLLLRTSVAAAADWPCWRGPNHDGKSPESLDLSNWAAATRSPQWTANVGRGHGTVAVAGGYVYVMGSDRNGKKEYVYCFSETAAGTNPAPQWVFEYSVRGWPSDSGAKRPGSTPAVATVGGQTCVYTMGNQGHLHCLVAGAKGSGGGKKNWYTTIDKARTRGVRTYGMNCSPLIYDNKVVLNAGTHGLAVNAHPKTATGGGTVLWGNSGQGAQASALPAQIGGADLVVFSYKTVYGIDRNGKPKWWYTWNGANGEGGNEICDPIVHDGRIFVTACLRKRNGDQFAPVPGKEGKLEWRYGHGVYTGGVVLMREGGEHYLYGVSHDDGDAGGRRRAGTDGKNQRMFCVRWNDGKEMWTHPFSCYASITATADGKLLVAESVESKRSDLVIVRARSSGYDSKAKRKRNVGTATYAAPVLANGRIYFRDKEGKIVCYNFGR